MIDLREFKKKLNRLSDKLLWALIYMPGVILNKDGSFMTVIEFRGRDLNSSTDEEMMVAVAQMNNAIKRLGSGWSIYSEMRRIRSTHYPKRQFPDKVTALIDYERKIHFENSEFYENRYYLTLTYLPPPDKYDRFEKFFIETEERVVNTEKQRNREHYKNFATEVERIYQLINKNVMTECRRLNDEETLTYLHSCISNKDHRVSVPSIPVFLDCILADTPFLGGTHPKLGTQHLAVISVIHFPILTKPGILDELNHLGFEYRWVTRYIPSDKADSEIELGKIRRQWFAKRKGLFTQLKEAITGGESAMIDVDAIEKYEDAQSALSSLGSDAVNFGYFTTCVVIKNEDKTLLEKNVRQIESAINSQGFTTIKETINAQDAWLGSIPAMSRHNVRRPMVNSLNLAHIFPLAAVWAGEVKNKHLNAPPLIQTITEGTTPFRLNIHIGDVGHTMIVGPTGSGKSVLLNVLAAQCRGYTNAQIYIFDKGGSCRVLTAGVGGHFYDLSAGAGKDSPSFQPLANIDRDSEKAWASEWLQQIYLQVGLKLTPEHKREIWEALCSLASSPKEQRVLSGFYLLLQNKELRNSITPFIRKVPGVSEDGAYSKLFDSSKDTLAYGSWQAFEMEELMETKGAVMPALQYLFHVIEGNCTGDPTFIILDECWVYLDNPLFESKIREWLKVMRKNNVSIIFATQNLEDISKSNIAPAIIESCLTKIFLPNANALNDASAETYKRFDINGTERRIIATAIQKQHYYYKSSLGSRLFELGLHRMPLTLAYVGSAGKQDQKKCKELLQNHLSDFNYRWLKYKNLNQYVEIFEDDNLPE